MRIRCAVTVLGLLSAAVPTAARAQDRADAAWNAGHHAVAESLYVRRLAADSLDEVALHRLALLTAWRGDYRESLTLFDRLLHLTPDNLDARVDRARVTAWQGNLDDAIAQLQTVLANHPRHLRALETRARIAGWAGETELAMTTYDQLLEIRPGDPGIRRNQAQVLSWALRYGDALAMYTDLLTDHPDDREALIGLARVLSWSGQLDSAASIYERMIATDSTDLDAAQGRARTRTWTGQLRQGEALWRRALALDSANVLSLVGLAQTLRWQGRHAAALGLLQRALALSPNDRDVLTQLRWTRTAMGPTVGTDVVYESDSDGNDILSTTLRTSWRPHPYVQLSMASYRRSAALDFPGIATRTSYGTTITVWGQREPGWSGSVSVGGTGSNAAAGNVTSVAASVSSPARNLLAGTFGFAHTAFDFSQPLIERGVTVTQWTLTGRTRLPGRWTATSGLSHAVFRGSATNHRTDWNGSVSRPITARWTVGARARLFGFTRDLNDGYFDPSYFGLWEVSGTWQREWHRISFRLDAAPGVQQVRSADLTGTVRVTGSATYRPAPGREIGVRLVFSSAGIRTLSTSAADYRYRAIALTAGWLF